MIGEERFFSIKPLGFAILIQLANFLSEAFVIKEVALNQFGKLLLRYDYGPLCMGTKQKDLMQIFSNDVAFLDKQKLTFSKKFLLNEILFFVI